MPRLIKQTFIVLVLVLLVFDGPLVTKCISMKKSIIMFMLLIWILMNVITFHLSLVYTGGVDVAIMLQRHLVEYAFPMKNKM